MIFGEGRFQRISAVEQRGRKVGREQTMHESCTPWGKRDEKHLADYVGIVDGLFIFLAKITRSIMDSKM